VDEGPGSRIGSKGLIGAVYEHIALRHRGSVWITDDGARPGRECEHVCYSYFPESGHVCLLNVDFDRPHRFFLHGRSSGEQIELAGGEFRLLDASSTVGEQAANESVAGPAGDGDAHESRSSDANAVRR
jgi:hypothetical protein